MNFMFHRHLIIFQVCAFLIFGLSSTFPQRRLYQFQKLEIRWVAFCTTIGQTVIIQLAEKCKKRSRFHKKS